MKRYKGTLTVEAAIILPLLFVVTFAACEWGWYFWKTQEVANAARVGVRLASLPNTTNAQVETLITNLMKAHFKDFNYDESCTLYPTDIENCAPGTPITVRITVDSDDVLVYSLSLLPFQKTIWASVTMSKEGPG